jgi:hypothetical protein
MDEFNLWAGACSHVHTDLEVGQRESFADAIRQSEGHNRDAPSFSWDAMVHLGDLNRGHPEPPSDEDGQEIHRQWTAMRKHDREQIYNILGNHDASSYKEETQWWFQKWIDPIGENPDVSDVKNENRPFPVEGTWERYSFQVGNILFLMMGDRNDREPPIGRSEDRGGYPAGAVSEETFNWWKQMVEKHQDKIIVSCHHHMLRDTTVASGKWEGIMGNYHGYRDNGAPEGSSYLYFLGDEPDAGAFESYLRENPGSIDLWLGGHTHAVPGDTFGGKSHIERKWDVTFINVAPMSKHHMAANDGLEFTPLTRLLTFVPDEELVQIRCYLHTDDIAPIGWLESELRIIPLRHPFSGIESIHSSGERGSHTGGIGSDIQQSGH